MSERPTQGSQKSVGTPPSALRRATNAVSSSIAAGSIAGALIGYELLL